MLIKNILKGELLNKEIKVSGWIRSKRDSKNVCFLNINDGSTILNLQAVLDKSLINFDDELSKANTGASIEIEGKLIKSQGEEQSVELNATKITVLGTVEDDFPMQKKKHSFEFLREIAHLRVRSNTFSAVARVRSAMSYAIHKFFQERDFIYVHTPIITANDCEGAGEMFQVTTLDIEKLKNSDTPLDYKDDFFGKKASLTVSGQLSAETYACALSNVYTFGPTFRAENSNTTRHLAEFWMIEPEMAFCTLEGNMKIAEEFIKYILKYVLENCADDMDFFNKWISPGIIETLKEVIEKPFIHITYTKAIEILGKHSQEFQYKPEWGIDLQTEHEKYLTEKIYNAPVIVTDYPSKIKAFYMKLNEDGKTVKAMDVLVPKLGEIIGGSERESDYNKLIKKMEELNLDPKDYWWYLDLRRYGTVPHSGFGLGFERLIQYITGMSNIRDVIPYYRTVGCAEF